MTTTPKTKRPAKTTPKKRGAARKTDLPPLPPTADVAKIAGTDYLVMPLEQYYEWCEDRALSVIAAERLQRQEHLAVPFEDIVKSQERKRAKKSGK